MEWTYINRRTLVGNGAPSRKGIIMFALITFSIIGATTLAASIATVVVTARDGYRQVPVRRF